MLVENCKNNYDLIDTKNTALPHNERSKFFSSLNKLSIMVIRDRKKYRGIQNRKKNLYYVTTSERNV